MVVMMMMMRGCKILITSLYLFFFFKFLSLFFFINQPTKNQGDYTTDYNVEMPFQAAASDNRPWLMLPYFEAMEMHVPLAQWRASMAVWGPGRAGPPGLLENAFSLWCQTVPGCRAGFGGMEWPSHVARWPGLFHTTDSAIKAIGAFVAANFITYVDYTGDTDFMADRAYPLLLLVADFYESYAVWDGARFNVPYACAQEQCSAQGPPGTTGNMTVSNNPPYDLALAKLVLRRLLAWSSVLGRDAARRSAWQHLLDNLAPYPLTVSEQGAPVFAQANITGGFPTRRNPMNARYPIVYFAAIYPGEEVGPDSPPALQQIAADTVLAVNAFNAWSPTNGMCMAWPPATRVVRNASLLLAEFTAAVRLTRQSNGFPNIVNHPTAGSGCPLENAGATLAVNELLLMSANFTLRFFPNGWPTGQPAAFQSLRAKGGFLVSARAQGGAILGNVTIESLAGATCVFVPPAAQGPLGQPATLTRVYDTSVGDRPVPVQPAPGGKLAFNTTRGHTYVLCHP